MGSQRLEWKAMLPGMKVADTPSSSSALSASNVLSGPATTVLLGHLTHASSTSQRNFESGGSIGDPVAQTQRPGCSPSPPSSWCSWIHPARPSSYVMYGQPATRAVTHHTIRVVHHSVRPGETEKSALSTSSSATSFQRSDRTEAPREPLMSSCRRASRCGQPAGEAVYPRT